MKTPRMPRRRMAAAALLAWLGGAAGPGAQEATEYPEAVPESPAFTFLEASPARIARPSSFRDVGVALINGIDQEGRASQGFALEGTGWNLLQPDLRAYQSDWWRRTLTNVRVSVGTVKATGDSAATDLAVGLNLTLWDGGDLMADRSFTSELGRRLQGCAPDSPGAGTSEECLRAARAGLVKEKARWNATRVGLSLALGSRLVDSELSDGAFLGGRAWLVGAMGLGTWGQALAQGAYTYRPALEGATQYQSGSGGIRAIAGSAQVNGFVEILGERRWGTDDGADDTAGQWSLGVEARVAKDLWLSTGFGDRFAAHAAAPDRVIVIANVRWGVASAARMGMVR
ncbi:MAG: hypothetical protein ABIL09_06595 [Gemmatimonadota bacterium]